jgi:restriction-modification enzyme MmeI-like protein
MSASITPQQFVAKWRKVTLKERSAAQEHFIDLCRLIGHETPAEADRIGATFAFEAGVSKIGGGQGFADVWKKGFFAWEYKGNHANLDKAYQQLQQYREALDNPPLLIVSDLQRIIIHTSVTNKKHEVYALTLDDLLVPAKLQLLRNVFTNYQALISPETVEKVTEDAAREFAQLADLLRQWGAEPHAAAHFLIRLLFCLFAEDVGLLPNHVFTHLVQKTRKQPHVFAAQLKQLFAEMAHGGFFSLEPIPHFDGGLFDDDAVLDLRGDGLEVLAKASALDWASIDPSILGTLFERSLDPGKRSQLGAHFTSRDDIEAHRKLDDAVLNAYGWPHDLSDHDILARLLALNLERAGAIAM